VEGVEILPNGEMATPTQHPFDDVGWFDLGTKPGDRGSAVLDGHLDRPGGYPAVFWNLRKLHPGDEVLVIDAEGHTLHFRVMQVALYPPQQAPLQAIFGNMGGRYLNLITCAGDWIPSEHQTTLRLVVYTVLV
jgi:sortase (surface protein transpeptidase)